MMISHCIKENMGFIFSCAKDVQRLVGFKIFLPTLISYVILWINKTFYKSKSIRKATFFE